MPPVQYMSTSVFSLSAAERGSNWKEGRERGGEEGRGEERRGEGGRLGKEGVQGYAFQHES